MIGFLRGKLLKRTPEVVLLDVQGVGYEVHIPVSTYYEIEKVDDDALVGLHIHTYLRDDGLSLFGFWTEREKVLFEKLKGVGGIGPRLARVILSGMPPQDLLSALSAGDVVRLSSIPGVGKKTAQRMVLELKDKLADLAAELPPTPPTATATAGDDLVSALVNLGYKPAQVERVVAEVRREHEGAPFPDLLRFSLRRLSRA